MNPAVDVNGVDVCFSAVGAAEDEAEVLVVLLDALVDALADALVDPVAELVDVLPGQFPYAD